MNGSFSPRKQNLGAYAYGAWTYSTPDSSIDEQCLSFSCDASHQLDDSMCVWISFAVLRYLPVQDDEECQARAAFMVESEGLGCSVLRCNHIVR